MNKDLFKKLLDKILKVIQLQDLLPSNCEGKLNLQFLILLLNKICMKFNLWLLLLLLYKVAMPIQFVAM